MPSVSVARGLIRRTAHPSALVLGCVLLGGYAIATGPISMAAATAGVAAGLALSGST